RREQSCQWMAVARWNDRFAAAQGCAGGKPCSRRLSAANIHMNRVERSMSADIEPVTPRAAETDIGDLLGCRDLADEVSARGNTMHAVACARPDITVGVDAEAVGNSGRDLRDHAALIQPSVCDFEGADVVRPVRVRPEA